ncbi:tRNA(Ser) Um(44) 2'-O-methyltransferase [Coemansia brasiliensis]|uniref:tRNA (uracil-O(2)-)-methyltransferase n=1 Tax=Coemansia brasiliensis TaxID=2650707 RepID=A0A9W8IFS0_9FUNG|nr:tRNA(Ser) Um(44) 2'-O-methyltransferase [Coemansia brasiliensis]
MTQCIPAAEETDTATEALRLAEFSKYKPEFFTEDIKEMQVAEASWRILALADITDAQDEHFLSVVEKWTLAAEIIIPPVERTAILDFHVSSKNKAISHVRRTLIPKRKSKDPVLEEDVIVCKDSTGIYAQFIPQVGSSSDIPFYYPQVYAYAFALLYPQTDCTSSKLAILVSELHPGSAVATKKQQNVWRELLKKLYKWTVTERFGYQKHIVLDVVVSYDHYIAKYHALKSKYALKWVKNWPEQTDPRKFVYEDISIASWLICLWEQDSSTENATKPTFADLGCGNGFLVYLLTSEGYLGYGIDQCSRKIWTQYDCKVDLRAQTLEPYRCIPDVDWVIGNHADELAPWIPIIAARSTTATTKFVVIPCCPHGLSGRKMPLKAAAGQSKYHTYVKYIKELAEQCGFIAEQEYLRIPSTKNVAILGRARSAIDCQTQINGLVESGKSEFVARIPDSVKNELRLAKAQLRANNIDPTE